MANPSKGDPVPSGYARLPGSEQRVPQGAKLLGPADPNETFKVSVVLRRRIDQKAPPSFDYFSRIQKGKRKRMPEAVFAARHGAHPDDIDKIEQFAQHAGLNVLSKHAARRIVELSGTVANMSKAFGVTLHRYEHTLERRVRKQRLQVPEVYRGHDGHVHVPKGIADLIVGVFGLDTRAITHRNSNDPPNTGYVTVQHVAQLYNFPTNSAAAETIGIMSPTGGYGGYLASDLQLFFGASLPTVTPISVAGIVNGFLQTATTAQAAAGATSLKLASTAGILVGSTLWIPTLNLATGVSTVSGSTVTLSPPLTAAVPSNTQVYINPDGETSQDIQIAGAAAPGAGINVFFSNWDQMGWVDLISRAVTPNPGEPACSVLSSSWYILNGDDSVTRPSALLDAISLAFQDAAHQFITVCIASGDTGANSKAGHYPTNFNPLTYGGDGKQHVQYPASDPWVLAVGGTTIGNIIASPPSFDEYNWNDPNPTDPTQWGTTGGGVSAYFLLPPYQENAGVPVSLRDGTTVGRGVPDVAGNASYNSGYSGLFVAGQADIGNGTSASAPLWAGLIAVINAALGEHVGFINPLIYRFGSSVFRDIKPPPGPPDNSNNTIPGYPAGPGWDACTGWGSPDGVALLNALQPLPSVYISGGYQSPDIILTDLTTNTPVPLGGAPGGPWDTQLKPSTPYGFSAVVHNISATAANGVQVTFWSIPGGLGTNGTMVGAPVAVNIPAFSSVTVQSTASFVSAPAAQHLCAVISVYSPGSACNVAAANALQIPDPGAAGSHACSAWRNTDSTLVERNSRFKFQLALGKLSDRLQEEVALHVQSTHVPAKWPQLARAKEVEDIVRFVGAEPRIPVYLFPIVLNRLPRIDLETRVAALTEGKVKHAGGETWKLHAHGDAPAIEISGKLPANVKNGDVVLVKVTAAWPPIDDRTERSVEFLEFIHVT